MIFLKLTISLELYRFTPSRFVSVNQFWLWLELMKNEGVFTNRAMAYIKQRKYKEALLDCENALYLNDKFAKAHMRA